MPGNDGFARLLMHFDGANGSTSFTDSTSANTNKGAATVIAPAQVSTAQSVFGGASALFDGATAGLTYPDNADWEFGSGNFTIDCWIRPTAFGTGTNGAAIVVHSSADTVNEWRLFLSDTTGNAQTLAFHQFVNNGAGGSNFVGGPNSAITLNVWQHVAIVRNGDVLTLYRGGINMSQLTLSAGYSFPDIIGTLEIGSIITSTWFYTGNIDELRISKGVARWTANFIPPTAPYNAYIGFDNEDNTKDFPVLNIKHRVAEY
jgi:hypothetical protein